MRASVATRTRIQLEQFTRISRIRGDLLEHAPPHGVGTIAWAAVDPTWGLLGPDAGAATRGAGGGQTRGKDASDHICHPAQPGVPYAVLPGNLLYVGTAPSAPATHTVCVCAAYPVLPIGAGGRVVVRD
jgi:hypothetical protein